MKCVCTTCNGNRGKHIRGTALMQGSWKVCENCNGRGWTKESVVSTTALKAWIRSNDTEGMIVIDPLEMYAKIAEWEGE